MINSFGPTAYVKYANVAQSASLLVIRTRCVPKNVALAPAGGMQLLVIAAWCYATIGSVGTTTCETCVAITTPTKYGTLTSKIPDSDFSLPSHPFEPAYFSKGAAIQTESITMYPLLGDGSRGREALDADSRLLLCSCPLGPPVSKQPGGQRISSGT